MRYELHVSAGDASEGTRHFVSDEEYAVGDELGFGGEIWRVEGVEPREESEGTVTRLHAVPARERS